MSGDRIGAGPELEPELATLDLTGGQIVDALGTASAQQMESGLLPEFLPKQRWFGAKDSAIKGVSLLPLCELVPGKHALVAADVALPTETQRYLLPLSTLWEEAAASSSRFTPVLARLSAQDRAGVLIDSALHPELATALLDAMREGRKVSSGSGEVLFEKGEGLIALGDVGEPRQLGAE